MSLRKKVLDGEKLFRVYWVDLNGFSIANLSRTVNAINPRTGAPFTKDAVYKAMWRWAARPENFQTAYKIFKQSQVGRGEDWTEDKFRVELAEKSRWILTKTQYRKWYVGTTN